MVAAVVPLETSWNFPFRSEAIVWEEVMSVRCHEKRLELHREAQDAVDLWWMVCHGGSGWWFGTWLDYDFPYIGNVIIPTDFHSMIFQRGRAQPPTRGFLQWGYFKMGGLFHGTPYLNGWFGGTPSLGKLHMVDVTWWIWWKSAVHLKTERIHRICVERWWTMIYPLVI